MSLSLRKEQVLAVLSIAIGAWVYSGFGPSVGARNPLNPGVIEFDYVPERLRR